MRIAGFKCIVKIKRQTFAWGLLPHMTVCNFLKIIYDDKFTHRCFDMSLTEASLGGGGGVNITREEGNVLASTYLPRCETDPEMTLPTPRF